jgi:CDP-paratose 2-epimerase
MFIVSVVLITGSAGLIGSEAVKFFHAKGFEIAGVDNNLREYFFGRDGSTLWNRKQLEQKHPRYTHHDFDIRDEKSVEMLFKHYGKNIALVIHAAAQPSHDWSVREPLTDFHVNATGTLHLLNAYLKHCPTAAFIYTSTNKVYGDTPNRLPLVEKATRWEIQENHPYHEFGIDESMSIDQCKHSLFGASKLAADIMVQEYGRYFNLKTGVFRGGCLTGPAHSGAELHGFLAYLVKCAMIGREYTIYGYKGKQVRDNIHSADLISAFWSFFENPREAAVYNIGGSRHSNCSILEAIELVKKCSGRELKYKLSPENRSGDHIWWISDVRGFQKDYPDWKYQYDMGRIIEEIVAAASERESAAA